MQSRICGVLDLGTCSDKERYLPFRWALGTVHGYQEQPPVVPTQKIVTAKSLQSFG